MNAKIVKGLASITRSKNRRKILYFINDGIKTPSQIAKETNMDNSHVSKYLNSMKELGLIVCLNEEESQGRLHIITDLG
ncbi:MAG: winged helix-turn-helix domain-containing protein, partial [Methanobrevibacter sp.]|nr:winged helix-turn-helix domain-containing protein [Candidatus Methanoflexus mossambicus]